jgi:proliferating cell nuclear antigen
MEFTISDVKKSEYFQIIFQNIKLFTDIYNIEFKNDGLFVQGMDNSHVTIFEINLSKDWFSSYECNESLSIGLHSGIFNKILSTRDSIQNIKIEYNDDSLDISFEHPTTSFNKYFRMPLVDFDGDRMEIPPCDYTISMEFDSKEWKKILDQLSSFGDSITFDCDDDKVNMISETVEGKMNASIQSSTMETYIADENCQVHASFNAKFLQLMSNFYKLNQNIIFNLSQDIPCCFRYNLSDSDSIRFYLAPQIDN